MDYALFVLLGFAASLVSAVFGFGTAIIVLAIGAHVLPVKETIALATVLFTASTVTKTMLYARRIDWVVAATMALVSLPFAYLGATLLSHLDAELLRRALGAMVLAHVVLTITRRLPAITLGTRGLLAGCAAYGFVSGLLGSGNLVKVVVLRELGLVKEGFVGVMAATSVLANVAKLAAYTNAGLLGATQHTVTIAALVSSAIIAALIGRHWLQRMSSSHFATGTTAVAGVCAIGLLL